MTECMYESDHLKSMHSLVCDPNQCPIGNSLFIPKPAFYHYIYHEAFSRHKVMKKITSRSFDVRSMYVQRFNNKKIPLKKINAINKGPMLSLVLFC